MKDAAKKFRKTCEKCNKPFSTANESEVLCRECRIFSLIPRTSSFG